MSELPNSNNFLNNFEDRDYMNSHNNFRQTANPSAVGFD